MQIKESLDYGNTKKFSVPIPVLAFFVSLFSMVVMFAIYEYAPFGPLTIWISDLKVQYAPFLSSLRSHLLEGKLTSYSFHTGLGKNSMGLFAYYLSSPFNLLVLLFPASQISQAMAVIIILKMSLASAFMSFFLCVRRQDK
ncbi:MAG TPA: YfhO family protein, partial [Clostridiaceae bacterium]|nr:YfhO family protein [Clostridiaceae bacterium]